MDNASRWNRLIKHMHRFGTNELADVFGSFQTPGQPPVENLPLMVDRNLEYVGPDGRFVSDVVGITFYTSDLATAARGDLFVIAGERFIVEKLIADDGHMITAATMGAP